MDPNNTNPSNTPPANDTPPAPEPTPTPESTPAVAPATPQSTPAQDAPAPTAPETPVFGAPAVQPEVSETPVFGQAPTESTAATAATTPDAAATPAAAPAATFSTGGASPEGPQADKKKKLILIGAIVAGVIVLGAIGFFIFSLLTSVSREEYRDAARQFNQVSSASASLTSDARMLGYSSGNTPEEDFQEDVAEAEASITTLKAENDELSKMKAVRVGEGGKLYSAFNDKLEAYTAYATELVTSVKNLRPALATCNSVNDAEEAPARVEALKGCSSALAGVTDVPNAQMKTYVEALSKGYGDYANVYEQIAGLSDPFGDQYEQYKTLRDQMYDIQDTIGDAGDTFSEALKARDEELSVKESADALADYLTEQQR